LAFWPATSKSTVGCATDNQHILARPVFASALYWRWLDVSGFWSCSWMALDIYPGGIDDNNFDGFCFFV
jgi:hypothetical protein